MEGSRRSLLDSTRNSNFLRRSFGTSKSSNQPSVLSREDYLMVLRREHQQWRDLLNQKKKAALRNEEDLVIRREDVLFRLKPEDRAFLDARPNYLEIVKNAHLHIQRANHYVKLAQDFKHHCETILEDIAEDVDGIVDKLLQEENEPCLLCNNGFCTKELHPLVELERNFASVTSEMVELQLSDSF